LGVFDTQSGQLVNAFNVGNGPMLQVNKVDCHPTMSVAALAHDSGEVTLFDFMAGKVSKTLTKAHVNGVSSALFVNSGLNLITGGHDGSVRVWDLRNTNKAVIQEAK
jgi:WD40 repeat protein